MTRIVKHLSPATYGAWDDYVNQHHSSTFYHLSGWKKVIEMTYSHQCYYLYVVEQESIVAVLPLVHVKSRLFGNTLVSTPFCIQGGILANDQQAQQLLVTHAKALAQELAVDYVEFRQQFDSSIDDELIGATKDSHVVFGCELASDKSQILANIKKKQRAVVRQSLKNDLSYVIEKNIDNLYAIYSLSVRNLGTPVFSKSLFTNLLDVFGEQCEVLTVFSQGTAVSSVMSFYFNGRVLPHFGGGTDAARGLKSNDFMYYQLMCHSAEKGCDYFDFGRSQIDSGPYRYKKHWGMTMRPASNHYFLHRISKTPSLNVSNPKYALAIKVWKKLPVRVTQLIGPPISQYLG